MRIAQVVHWFLPRHASGTEVYTASLAGELAERHEVSLFCREDGRPGEFREANESYRGLPVRRVHTPPAGDLVSKALARIRNPRIEGSFRRYLCEFEPDIVHFQHLFKLSGRLIAIAHSLGIPSVVTLHDYWFLCYNGQLLRPGIRRCAGPVGGLRCPGCAELDGPAWAPWVLSPLLMPFMAYRTWFLRRALMGADAIISPSRHLADVFARHGLAGRILVSDNGTDVSWAAKGRRTPSARVRFGYIGTLSCHKGAHVLLEAFAGLQQGSAELRVHGALGPDAAYAERLRGMATEGVRFLGPFDPAKIAEVLSEIDVLVVPSVWAENSPVTIHEARTAGVPVIASDIGGMPELVKGGRAGWLVPPGDPGALGRLMRRLVEQPDLIEGSRAQILPVKTIQEQAVELEGLYESLIAGRGPHP